MSNLPNISITHTFNGDVAATNKVDAAELDSQLGSLATNDNRQKAAIDRITDGNNDLASGTVGFSQLKPELQGAFASTAGWQPKASVTLATTGNITLSGEQTIDGTLTSSSRVLVKDQSTASQNGIYTTGAGAWTRTTDADTGAELAYAVVSVTSGSTQSGTAWVTTNSTAPTIGTTAIQWVKAPGNAVSTAMTPVVQAQTLVLAWSQFGLPGFINVRHFGAVGDGSTDDTTAIQAAINSIPTTSGGSLPTLPSVTGVGGTILFFPKGVYKISSALVIGSRRIFISGSCGGMNASHGSTLYQSNANADHIDYSAGSLDGISVYGMVFFGMGKGSGTGNGLRLGRAAQTAFSCNVHHCWFTAIPNACIYADYTADLSVQDCGLENAVYGVYIKNAGIPEGDINKIQNSTLYALTNGVYVEAGSNLLIAGNQINLCGANPGGAMDDVTGGIVIKKSGAPSVRGTAIVGNMFRTNVTDIILDGSAGSSIGSNTGVIDTSIIGNTSDRCFRRFARIDDTSGTRIVDNTITSPNVSGGAYDAIDLQDTATLTVVDGNTVSTVAGSVPRYSLAIGASTTNTTIGNNVFSGSTGAISLSSGATLASNQQMHGTWTPVLVGAGTAGSHTYSVQNGKFTRFGDMVWASCQLAMSAKDAAMAGSVTVRGLPFVVRSGDAPVSVAIGGFSNITLAANRYLTARSSGSVSGAVDLISSNSAGTLAAIDSSAIAATTEIDITICYRSAPGSTLASGCTVI